MQQPLPGQLLAVADLLAIAAEMRERHVANYFKSNTLIAWANRIEAAIPQLGDGVDAARLDWLRDNEFDLVTRREDIDEDEYHILWFVIDPRKTTRKHLHSISGHPLASPREAIDAATARSAAPSAKGVANG